MDVKDLKPFIARKEAELRNAISAAVKEIEDETGIDVTGVYVSFVNAGNYDTGKRFSVLSSVSIKVDF